MLLDETRIVLKSRKTLVDDRIKIFGNPDLYIVIGERNLIDAFMVNNQEDIITWHRDNYSINSLMPLADLSQYNARIEPGAIIRTKVEIKNQAVILMGAVINCGATIGEKTMIDMNAVIGSGAIIGANCHIGAGAVIAGIMEPKATKPVVIEDNVFIGANAVILEGVTIGQGSIVGAGSVVTKNVLENQTVVGVPAKVIKRKTIYQIEEGLR